jgi:hypothetical protein
VRLKEGAKGRTYVRLQQQNAAYLRKETDLMGVSDPL